MICRDDAVSANLQAQVVFPDGSSDSFWVTVDDETLALNNGANVQYLHTSERWLSVWDWSNPFQLTLPPLARNNSGGWTLRTLKLCRRTVQVTYIIYYLYLIYILSIKSCFKSVSLKQFYKS